MSDILNKHVAFVKDQVKFHRERSEAFSKNNFRKQKHNETAEKFQSLLDYLESLETNSQIKGDYSLVLTPDDLEGLPQELLNELSISDADRAEFKIMEYIREHGGMMSLDQIMVAHYQATGEIVKRSAMTNRLYRMANKGLIDSVPNKKGVYALKNAQKELFEQEDSES